MQERTIYLDHAATTPVDPAVLAAMLPYFSECYGNPSSIYRLGRTALQALDDARSVTASVLGCSPKELVFLGGGSEADNLAVKGAAFAARDAGKGSHVVTSAIEHHAVLHAFDYLAAFGFEVTVLPVDGDGLVAPDDLRAALRPDTVLASIMYANNEIGAVEPIAELGAMCRERGVLFHTDAVQAPGSLSIDVGELDVDLLSLTAHKFYGPKGVGALYVRRGTQLMTQINGGGQERRRRAGTENVAGIVGFAEALRLADERRESYAAACRTLRDRLIDGIFERIPGVRLNGSREHRLANNANLSFVAAEGESILLLLDQAGICASSGSACSSGSLEPSHVLMALGLDADAANGSVRFTVGLSTTVEDVDYVLEVLPPMIARLRSVSPEWEEVSGSKYQVSSS